MSDDEECAPLTGAGPRAVGASGPVKYNDCVNSFGRRDGDIGGSSDDGDDNAGYANYQQPNQFLRMGRYNGYSALGAGQVSMHDSRDDPSVGMDDDADYGNDDEKDDKIEGGFVSFWRHHVVDGDSRAFYGAERQKRPQYRSRVGSAVDDDGDEDDDDRVETTVRPLPLHYRGAMGQNVIHDSSGALGSSHAHFGAEDGRRNRRRNINWWGFGRRESSPGFDNFDVGDDDDDDGDNDANSLLGSSSSDDVGHCVMPTPAPSARSPFRFDLSRRDGPRNEIGNDGIFGRGRGEAGGLLALPLVRPFVRGSPRGLTDSNHSPEKIEGKDARNENANGNIFGRRGRREGGGVLGLQIVRPFLRGSSRGFADSKRPLDDDGDDDIDIDDCAGNAPSRRDREAVARSISRGIAGVNDDSLLLDPAGGGEADRRSKWGDTRPHPNLLQRIFTTRFLQAPDDAGRRKRGAGNISIVQLHKLLRKEDWSLAASLLESNPHLARTWHNVDRLYGGRYDGNALPIHAACALRPPPSFIEMLAELYPGGLRERDGSFGRVPLHVACRSLASSDVINALCRMDAECVTERDTLKRVPLHYMIKNYTTLGDDDAVDDGSLVGDKRAADVDANDQDEDGMIVLQMLVGADPSCVRAIDHRGWVPLHVACSCSSRRGMLRVMRFLLKIWPDAVNAKTERESDVFDCVDMAGKVHPTRERVISLLRETMDKVEGTDASNNGVHKREVREDDSKGIAREAAIKIDGNADKGVDRRADLSSVGVVWEDSLLSGVASSQDKGQVRRPNSPPLLGMNRETPLSSPDRDAAASTLDERVGKRCPALSGVGREGIRSLDEGDISLTTKISSCSQLGATSDFS